MSFSIKQCVIEIQSLLSKNNLSTLQYTEVEDKTLFNEIDDYLGHIETNVQRWKDQLQDKKDLQKKSDNQIQGAIVNLYKMGVLKIDIKDLHHEKSENDLLQETVSIINNIIKALHECRKKGHSAPALFSYLDKIRTGLIALENEDKNVEDISNDITPNDIEKLHKEIRKKIHQMQKQFYQTTWPSSIAQDITLITISAEEIQDLVNLSRMQIKNSRSLIKNKKLSKDQISKLISIDLMQIEKLVEKIGQILTITGPAAKRINGRTKGAIVTPTLSYIAGAIDTLSLLLSLPEIGPIY